MNLLHKLDKILLKITVLLSLSSQLFGQNDSSVLNNGNWSKVSVTQEGIYSLSAQDLETLGLGSAPFNSEKIGIYGRTSGSLPEVNAVSRENDLLPLHILIEDGNDGELSGPDRIYFYAESPSKWEYDENLDGYEFVKNIYSDEQIYFVTSTQGGERIQNSSELTGLSKVINRYSHLAHHEIDNQNLVGSGRQWFGELFDFNLSRNIDLGLDALDSLSSARFKVRAISRSTIAGTKMDVSSGQGPFGSLIFGAVSSSSSSDYAAASFLQANQSYSAGNWGNVNLSFDRSINSSASAWLDYINVSADSPFRWRQMAMVWNFPPQDTGVVQANLSLVSGGLAANGKIWNVTNPISPTKIQPLSFLSGGNAKWGIKMRGDTSQKILIFQPGSTGTPILIGPVPNQNLHGLGFIDYIIVSPQHLMVEAQRLAEFHNSQGQLRAMAIDVQKIYNEFSSGVQDLTAIKDFLRHLWKKATLEEDRPEFLLLFGDASYDFKNRITPNTNQIPIYQSEKSFSLYSSFSTDDFFGFMDDDEGNNLRAKKLDLCIGRIPVNTSKEAKNVVDKILSYSNPETSRGVWRKKLLFVSDDVDAGWEAVLTSIPDAIAQRIDTVYPFLDVRKMYSDSYEQQSSSGSQSYPDLRSDLIQNINDGNLVTAYVGHGGEVGWSSENILQLNDTKNFSNANRLPLFITVTCEFSRLDDPLRTSAGEHLLLNPNGGAIALLSTTRVVYVDGAATLNDSIFRVAFEKEDGRFRTFGQILRSAKNSTTTSDKLRFSLLGDPAIRLNVPEHQVVIDSVNSRYFNSENDSIFVQTSDTLKALSYNEISGHIESGLTNEFLNQVNGEIEMTLYDKVSSESTLKNDNQGPFINFDQRNNIAYRGKAKVKNGRFDAQWILPLDISLDLGKGKFSFYAQFDSSDASGSDQRIWIGGIDTEAPLDVDGPIINVFMDDTSFVSGGITGPNPLGIIKLMDESGINTIGTGIGHDLMGCLDGDWNNAFSLNSRYISDPGTYKKGTATWPFIELEDGPHDFFVRAWDSYNNISQSSVSFQVVSKDNLQLGAFRIYPNPGMGPFQLDVEHNLKGDSLSTTWSIHNSNGSIVYLENWTGIAEDAVLNSIPWSGKDDSGNTLPTGWYIARIKITRLSDGQSVGSAERIILLH